MDTRQEPYPTRPYAAYVVATLFLAWFMCYVDRQIISLLVPSLKKGLLLSDTQVSLLQGIAFALVFSLAGLPFGRLADRTIRRNLIAGGLVFWSLATIACGLASNFWQLFAARTCVGMGEACLAPAVASLVADYFLPHHRGRALAFVQAGAPIGSSAALFFGGMLMASLTAGGLSMVAPHGWAVWKLVFIAAGLPGFLVAAMVMLLREPPRRERAQADGAGKAPGAGILSLLTARPATYGVIYALYACLFIIGYGLTAWAPTLLMRVYGLPPRNAGAVYATVMLTCSVGGYLLSGFVSDALRRRRPLDGRMLIPMFLLPVEMLAMAVFGLAHDLWLSVGMIALSSVTTGLSSTTALAVLQDIAPNRLRGQAVAIYLLVANLIGLGLAPTMVALVTDRVFHDEMMLQKSMALVAFSAAGVAFLLALAAPGLYRKARIALTDQETAESAGT